MSLTTKDNVLAIAPELSTLSDDLWNLYLGDVGNFISASEFGTKTEIAARYWVAHYLKLLQDTSLGTVSGPITKERVGDVMREYARITKVTKSEQDFSRTSYGMTFLGIRRTTIVAMTVIVPGI